MITTTFLRTTRLMVNQLMCLCYGASYHLRVIFYFRYIYVKTM
jgi:hypothetical protein